MAKGARWRHPLLGKCLPKRPDVGRREPFAVGRAAAPAAVSATKGTIRTWWGTIKRRVSATKPLAHIVVDLLERRLPRRLPKRRDSSGTRSSRSRMDLICPWRAWKWTGCLCGCFRTPVVAITTDSCSPRPNAGQVLVLRLFRNRSRLCKRRWLPNGRASGVANSDIPRIKRKAVATLRRQMRLRREDLYQKSLEGAAKAD